MSDDFPTYAEVGEQNVRERNKRDGRSSRLQYHVLGTPMTLIDLNESDAEARE
jgi:hypothetical protein